ncbi:MAG: HAMP domain-containing protein, partial [bacterium]|nr:HAMP domain-containing protein [bacterium]
MTEPNAPQAQSTSAPRFRGSIRRSLLAWFLALSLFPLFALSLISYLEARRELTATALHQLELAADSEVRFLRNWLDFRFRDLKSQAQSDANTQLLARLYDAWRESAVDLEAFVRSSEWAQIAEGPQQDFETLLRTYDYLHDLLLLDLEGNILFTVARERDLGTNVFSGESAKSDFARHARLARESGEAQLSDLEHYAPSKGVLASFVTAPIADDSGDMLGILAMRIRVDRMLAADNVKTSGRETVRTYLVGADGLLRTPLRLGVEEEVLTTRIQTEIFRVWRGEQDGARDQSDSQFTGTALPSTYTGPLGQRVIGVGRPLERGDLNWLIISEVDEQEALASVRRLGIAMLILVSLTMISVAGVAIYRARRITEPLVALTSFSKNVALGNLDEEMTVTTRDEVGELVEAFNQMIS